MDYNEFRMNSEEYSNEKVPETNVFNKDMNEIPMAFSMRATSTNMTDSGAKEIESPPEGSQGGNSGGSSGDGTGDSGDKETLPGSEFTYEETYDIHHQDAYYDPIPYDPNDPDAFLTEIENRINDEDPYNVTYKDWENYFSAMSDISGDNMYDLLKSDIMTYAEDSYFKSLNDEEQRRYMIARLETMGAVADYGDGEYNNYVSHMENTVFDEKTVLGAPFRFNPLSDPKRRVYEKTINSDLPIVTIIPGIPKFNHHFGTLNLFFQKHSYGANMTDGDRIAGEDGSVLSSSTSQIMKWMNSDGGNDGEIYNWLMESYKLNANSTALFKDPTDYRYYTFASAYGTYIRYLQVMLSALGAKLGTLKSIFSDTTSEFTKGFAMGKSCLKFNCSKSSGVSESVSNEFSESQVASAVNNTSNLAKELRFLIGSNESMLFNANQADVAEEFSKFGGEGGVAEILNSTMSLVKTSVNMALNGANISFPEIWRDSQFSRDYQLSFKFTSPYGDPESIYHYVYVPFLALLTLAMPRQEAVSGFISPFLMRIKCQFSINSLNFWKVQCNMHWIIRNRNLKY